MSPICMKFHTNMYSNGIDELEKKICEKKNCGFSAIFRSNLHDFGRFSPISTLKADFLRIENNCNNSFCNVPINLKFDTDDP